MLVNASDMLKNAEAGHYALGAFNTNNLEWTLAILQAAEEARSLRLSCSAPGGAAKWMGSYKVCADMVKACVEALDKITGSLLLCTSIMVPMRIASRPWMQALRPLCTTVLTEADFQTNLDRTKELVDLAHSRGLSIEAEVGGIGGTEDGVTSSGELADPEQCKQIADLGVDFLACGIGNIHGLYPKDWKGLSFERLGEIKALTGNLPLVLHGGTGIPEDQIKKAISAFLRSTSTPTFRLSMPRPFASMSRLARIYR